MNAVVGPSAMLVLRPMLVAGLLTVMLVSVFAASGGVCDRIGG